MREVHQGTEYRPHRTRRRHQSNSPTLRASREVDPPVLRTIRVVTKVDLVPPEQGAMTLSGAKHPPHLGYVGVVANVPRKAHWREQVTAVTHRTEPNRTSSRPTKSSVTFHLCFHHHLRDPGRWPGQKLFVDDSWTSLNLIWPIPFTMLPTPSNSSQKKPNTKSRRSTKTDGSRPSLTLLPNDGHTFKIQMIRGSLLPGPNSPPGARKKAFTR